MPVGTKATVKTLHPDEVRDLGAQILLGNTLPPALPARRRADPRARRAAPLHGWDGPILTDSGGFQVFSLRDTIARVDDDGVTFRSVYDGARRGSRPELAAQIQANLGSDIAMCLDQVPPAGVSRRELEDAVRRTTAWAERQRDAPRADGQLRFGITQGGIDPELRRRSTRGDRRARLRRQRDRRARDRRGPRGDVRDDRLGRRAAAGRQAALLHGDRRPRGDPRGDRGGRRHVRLRPADPHRAHRQRAHERGPPEPAQRPLRARRGAARRELRLPGLRALHAAPTSATSSTRTSCSACASSRSTIYAS